MIRLSMKTMTTLRQIRSDLGFTQVDLANQCGVTRHAILRMEQHVYPTPLPSVISYLADVTEYSELELIDQYSNEVTDHRLDSGRRWAVGTIPMDLATNSATSSLHPFATFRSSVAIRTNESTSQIRFCMAFSIHPYVLSQYESFRTSYPEGLNLALYSSGYPVEILDFFKTSPMYNSVIS